MPIIEDAPAIDAPVADADKTQADDSQAKDVLYPGQDKGPVGDADTDTSAEDVKKAEDADKAKEETDKPSEEAGKDTLSPITAEDLKFPEGINLNLDVQEKFLALANNNELSSKERAQEMINLQQDLYAAQAEAHQDQIDAWEKEASLDKRFIGDTGDKLDESRALAKKAIDMVAIEGLSELLSREQTGLGSHPVVFDLFVKIGKVMSEDSFKTGGAGGGGAEPLSDSEALYGKNKE